MEIQKVIPRWSYCYVPKKIDVPEFAWFLFTGRFYYSAGMPIAAAKLRDPRDALKKRFSKKLFYELSEKR